MTRHLMIAGLLLGMSNNALAETPDDKPTDVEAAAAELGIESADKQGRSSARGNSSRSSKPNSSARSGGGNRSSSSSARPSSGSRPASSSSARPNSSSPASSSAARPSNGSRPASSSAARPSNGSRPASSSSARPNPNSRPSSAARPASHSNAARPSAARPGAARPGATRPAHQVYRPNWAPNRWAPSYHRYHLRGVPHYSPRYWGSGVFYYNPPPRRHNVVVVNRTASGSNAGRADTPTRAVNRAGDFGIGMRAGSYMSGYEGDSGGYGDMGLGLTARFRPVESVGLEVSYGHHSQSWEDGSERINNPLQASVNLYAFPWTRVSPYATVGLTWNQRQINDEYYDEVTQDYTVVSSEDTLFGPHAGLGLELALGDSAALNFEGRYVSYLNMAEDDLSAPNAVQGNMGLTFYF